MGWLDKPTEEQINALWRWFRWQMPRAEAQDALKWLQKNATRRQVSEEMDRVRRLFHARKLSREECFSSDIWAEYFNLKTE